MLPSPYFCFFSPWLKFCLETIWERTRSVPCPLQFMESLCIVSFSLLGRNIQIHVRWTKSQQGRHSSLCQSYFFPTFQTIFIKFYQKKSLGWKTEIKSMRIQNRWGVFLWMSIAHANVKFSWVAVVINHRYHDPRPTCYTLHTIFLFHARSLFCILVGLFNAK